MAALTHHVFPFFSTQLYITTVLRDRKNIRKKALIMKKISMLLKEYYETYKEGRS
jgi:hypothetical protein